MTTGNQNWPVYPAPKYSAPVGGTMDSSLSNLGWLQQMCEGSGFMSGPACAAVPEPPRENDCHSLTPLIPEAMQDTFSSSGGSAAGSTVPDMNSSISEQEDEDDDEGMTMDYFTMNLLNSSADYPAKEAAEFSARLASTHRKQPLPTVPTINSFPFTAESTMLMSGDDDEDEEHEMEIYQRLRPLAGESAAEESGDDSDEVDSDGAADEPAVAAPAVVSPYAHLAPLPKIPVTNIAASRVVAKFDPRRVVNAQGGPPGATLVMHAANASTRPPYSYTAMIYMSMHAIGEDHVQLGQIYQQIMASWAYYSDRPNETGWKNSIRHNLTVCRCFKKVARAEGEPGKGGYWAINESMAKIDIVLGPRDNSPRLSRKKLKKKSKSRALAARRDKPRPVDYRLDRRGGVPSPSALSAAEDLASEDLASEEEDAAVPTTTMTTRRSARAAAHGKAEAEHVYPEHLFSGAFDAAAAGDEFAHAHHAHDEVEHPFPSMRAVEHTASVMLGQTCTDAMDETFTLSDSFTNGLLGGSLHNSHVLTSSFSNMLNAAGGLSATL